MKHTDRFFDAGEVRRQTLRAEYEGRINRVIDHINAHLGDELALEDLARIAAFSPYHFHRLFSGLTGEPLAAYIRRLRLERAACALLQNPRASITTIALDCGFASSAAFARAFRERFGMSASEWRAHPGEGDRQEEGDREEEDRKECEAFRNPGKAAGDADLYASSRSRRDRIATNDERRNAMEVEVKDLPGRRVAYLRKTGPYDQSAAQAWEGLCRWAGPRGLMTGATVFIGVSHDDPDITPPEKCRYDACIEVVASVTPEREIGIAELPAGRHAVARYEGPSGGIAGAYAELFGRWLPESGYQPGDSPCYEVYLKDPSDGIFQMDMCVPVKPL